ncbi:PTS fructose transporter subunit IIABC [Mesoplasma photuris]|uniref:PTS fructose transporter subunit IIABC n=1 Tax=Mesoplasma photuris TaxID=217731 RepID=UPI00068C1451|nr:fructose-specific PTS transporter subunit EIIC [Mesoplasma photuris]
MELKDFFKSKISFFKSNLETKDEVINFLTEKLLNEKIVDDASVFKAKILERESQDSTGIGDGIAIPHAITKHVKNPSIAFVSLEKPIEWGSLDNKPVDLVFMIATNDENGDAHLTALSNLSIALIDGANQAKIRKAKTFKELVEVFNTTKKAKTLETNDSGHYDVIGITACPTGIAHTYLAEEKLIESAKELGMTVKVETQGRRGTENRLTEEDIKNAKVIILAHDKAIAGMSRFNGVSVIDTNTKDVIFNGTKVIEQYQKGEGTKIVKVKADSEEMSDDFSLKKFFDFKGNLLAGVSRMLPFVVAGGIILGIAFLIDFAAGYTENLGINNEAAGWFAAIGKTAMMMMAPILGGYIAYTIVGPQGLMPGVVAGLLADGTGGFAYGAVDGWSGLWSKLFPMEIPMNSGFIGAMVGAYFAALIVFGLTKGFRNFKKSFHGVRDIVLIPILSLLGIAFTMFVINIPLGYAMFGIKEGLVWMAQNNLLILVGMLIGLMMCVDMGGPINKIAYTIGVMTTTGGLEVIVDGTDLSGVLMAAAMAGGMIPPLGIAVCTIMFRKVWTAKERDAAKANWLMGAFFITEGAIPFMVTDPKRISASALTGGAITGLMVGGFQITLSAAHGGVAVFPLLNSHIFEGAGTQMGAGIALYILSIVVGVMIMALILGFWKKADIKKGKLNVDHGIVLNPNKKTFSFKK